MAQTTIICTWNNVWIPNSGHKFIGFKRINAPADTTFGWIELDFRGDASSCDDSIIGIQLAYSTIPNIHLNAGETTIVGVEEISENSSFTPYPNPANDRLNFKFNSELENPIIKVYDLLGRIKYGSAGTGPIDISGFPAGIYMVEVVSSKRILWQRFRKE